MASASIEVHHTAFQFRVFVPVPGSASRTLLRNLTKAHTQLHADGRLNCLRNKQFCLRQCLHCNKKPPVSIGKKAVKG
jgi:hypothetical protein